MKCSISLPVSDDAGIALDENIGDCLVKKLSILIVTALMLMTVTCSIFASTAPNKAPTGVSVPCLIITHDNTTLPTAEINALAGDLPILSTNFLLKDNSARLANFADVSAATMESEAGLTNPDIAIQITTNNASVHSAFNTAQAAGLTNPV